MITTPVFPGSTRSREDLLERIKHYDRAYTAGGAAEETMTIYGRDNVEKTHRWFKRELKHYPQPTLGEMAADSRAEQICYERLSQPQRREWWQPAVCIGGLPVGGGGALLAYNVHNPTWQGIGIAATILGAAAFVGGTLILATSEERYAARKQNAEKFEGLLQRWGDEMLRAPSATRELTKILSPEEKRRLAEELLADAAAAEQKPPPKVEIKDGQVAVNGVAIPVKPPIR